LERIPAWARPNVEADVGNGRLRHITAEPGPGGTMPRVVWLPVINPKGSKKIGRNSSRVV